MSQVFEAIDMLIYWIPLIFNFDCCDEEKMLIFLLFGYE